MRGIVGRHRLANIPSIMLTESQVTAHQNLITESFELRFKTLLFEHFKIFGIF